MNLKKWWGDFPSNPHWIFWYYIIINMVPSIALLFTEPYNIAGKLILFFFPLGLYLLLYSLSKKTGLIHIFLFPLIFLHAFQLVLFYLFGEDVIAVDMFLNVVTTNVTEANEVLDSIWPSVIFVCVLYIPSIIIAAILCKRKIYLSRMVRRRSLIFGIVLLVATYGLSFFATNYNTQKYSYKQDVYPVNVIYNLKFAIIKWYKSERYFETSKDFLFGAHKKIKSNKREIYVLVVGETGRAESWGLYGYERNTTPKLASDSSLVLYRDAITQSNTTHKSVPIILSAASAENFDIIYRQKSIVTAFKEAGFTTVFLSNQSANHTFTDFYAQEADYVKYFRFENSGQNNLDEILLPDFKHYIDSIPNDLFIVLHTYGSHFNYRERYSDAFSVFKPDNVTEIKRKEKETLVNAYDNTILYVDNFLYTVSQMLAKSGACSAMFYCADHGEDLMDDDRYRFLHASPNPTFYQLRIPMLLWFSEVYSNSFPEQVKNAHNNKNKPVSTNAAFHTVLDMAQIETNYLESDLSLVNSTFKSKKRMYLDDHDNPIFYYNANLKKEDKEMIEKRHLSH